MQCLCSLCNLFTVEMKLYEYLDKLVNVTNVGWHIKLQFLKFRLEKKKKLFNLLLDVLFGVIMYCIITKTITNIQITRLILVVRTEIKDLLQDLLIWLMGAPAGLKLNHELTNVMGHFFLYHIYIWMGYLIAIESYLPSFISLIMYSSCFGASLFLCLLNDFINVLTFHIYCFHVYAAKLFRLQLCSLRSLARLFMGKKWNVLRARVDSITYEADQLILGTIIFTILLFLLPTTFMYYIVFTATRSVVLLIQTFFQCLVKLISNFPIYDVIMRFQDSSYKSGNAKMCEIHYVKYEDSDNARPISYTLSDQPISFVDMIAAEYNFSFPNVTEVVVKLLTGKILKPWRDNE